MVSDQRIPRTPLVASSPFSAQLGSEEVARSIARGLELGGTDGAEVCPLDDSGEEGCAAQLRAQLGQLDFDARLRRARALVIAAPRLEPRSLAASAAFELATRARQAGVPAYAVTAKVALNSFEARILDLQLIIEAGTERQLTAAGRKLALLL